MEAAKIIINVKIYFISFLTKKLSATFLLLSKWPAPCDYAARANPEGAKLSFAFVFRRLKYLSIPIQPPTIYSLNILSGTGGAAGFEAGSRIPSNIYSFTYKAKGAESQLLLRKKFKCAFQVILIKAIQLSGSIN